MHATSQTQTTNLGEFVREHRERNNLSQGELARQAYCTRGTVSYVEKNRRRLSLKLATSMDEVLHTGGELVKRAHQSLTQARPQRLHRPEQLPADIAELYGRDESLARLSESLSATRDTAPAITTVEGPAGVGKSALVVHWAHQHAQHYPDGVITAHLGGHTPGHTPADPGDVVADILGDLGITDLPESTPARSRLLRTVLAERHLLLLLDDAVDSDQVQPLLPGTSSCHVLITSRRRLTRLSLRGSATRIPLAPLSAAEAGHMLSNLLTPHRSLDGADDQHALARIVDGCDRLPLALCAAAEVITTHPGRELSQLVEPLTGPRRLHVLTTAAAGDPQSALRATLAASYQHLTPLAARLLQHLGAADHTCIDAVTARNLLDVPLEQAETALAELLAEHLLTPEACCPSLVRLFAAERAQDPPAEPHILPPRRAVLTDHS